MTIHVRFSEVHKVAFGIVKARKNGLACPRARLKSFVAEHYPKILRLREIVEVTNVRWGDTASGFGCVVAELMMLKFLDVLKSPGLRGWMAV